MSVAKFVGLIEECIFKFLCFFIGLSVNNGTIETGSLSLCDFRFGTSLFIKECLLIMVCFWAALLVYVSFVPICVVMLLLFIFYSLFSILFVNVR